MLFNKKHSLGKGSHGYEKGAEDRQVHIYRLPSQELGDDERHLCPLQLPLIDRALTMWSNPGDVVLSPFMGIGSEGVVAVKRKRKFIGCELKPAYWSQAVRAIRAAERDSVDLFAPG